MACSPAFSPTIVARPVSPDMEVETALRAVNLGDDADTTGAVYGQLAGAYYGEQGIPESWRAMLTHRHRLEDYAEQLLQVGHGSAPGPRGSTR